MCIGQGFKVNNIIAVHNLTPELPRATPVFGVILYIYKNTGVCVLKG